jgi:hypothetical protein
MPTNAKLSSTVPQMLDEGDNGFVHIKKKSDPRATQYFDATKDA